MSSKRQQIVDAIEARLGQIAPGVTFVLPDGSYTCQSAPRGVFPWRRTTFSKAELPALKLNDGAASVAPGPSGQHEHRLSLTLEAVLVGNTAASAGRQILADIVAAIGSDLKWGGLARWTELEGHELDLEQDGDIAAGARINFTVVYRTPLWRM